MQSFIGIIDDQRMYNVMYLYIYFFFYSDLPAINIIIIQYSTVLNKYTISIIVDSLLLSGLILIKALSSPQMNSLNWLGSLRGFHESQKIRLRRAVPMAGWGGSAFGDDLRAQGQHTESQ
jgi:hypothetical protein